MKGPFSSLALLFPLAVATATGAVAERPKGLSVDSPFAPAGAPAAAGVTMSSETIELAGVTTIGKDTNLVFFDKLAKKSHWLKKGETAAGITLVNYDAEQEKAVVRLNGAEKVLQLRKGKGTTGPGHVVAAVPTGFNTQEPVTSTGLPAAPPPPVQAVPSGPPTPETQAKQETEARMLVSDLLEIGMAQRRAYEEAQRKAAEAGGGNSAAPTPAAPTPEAPPPRQP